VNPFVVETSAHILWTKQAQCIQWTQRLFMPFLSCHFPSNTKYNVLILYARGGQPTRDQQPHFLCYRKEPHHTRGHTWRPPHLSLKHVPLLSYIYCKYHTQHDKDRILEDIYFYACYSILWDFRNYVRAAWNRAKSHMRLAGWSPLFYAIGWW